MPRSTKVVPVRIKIALAERVRLLAESTGRSTNSYLADLIAAALGTEGPSR